MTGSHCWRQRRAAAATTKGRGAAGTTAWRRERQVVHNSDCACCTQRNCNCFCDFARLCARQCQAKYAERVTAQQGRSGSAAAACPADQSPLGIPARLFLGPSWRTRRQSRRRQRSGTSRTCCSALASRLLGWRTGATRKRLRRVCFGDAASRRSSSLPPPPSPPPCAGPRSRW